MKISSYWDNGCLTLLNISRISHEQWSQKGWCITYEFYLRGQLALRFVLLWFVISQVELSWAELLHHFLKIDYVVLLKQMTPIV